MKEFCYGWLLVVSVAAGCGAQTSGSDDPNNGGRTSWLRSCDESEECSSLACLGSVCDACDFKVLDETLHQRLELEFEYGEAEIELRVP